MPSARRPPPGDSEGLSSTAGSDYRGRLRAIYDPETFRPFQFGPQDLADLRSDLREDGINKLATALQVLMAFGSVPGLSPKAIRREQQKIRGQLERAFDVLGKRPQGWFKPEPSQSFMNELGKMILDLRTELDHPRGRAGRRQREGSVRIGDARAFAEIAVLSTLQDLRVKTGGPRAARILTVVLRACLGVNISEDGAKRALQRARRSLPREG